MKKQITTKQAKKRFDKIDERLKDIDNRLFQIRHAYYGRNVEKMEKRIIKLEEILAV